MLLFVTDEGRNDLNKCRNWAFDDTFNVSPTIFYQLLTIHVHIGNEVIPHVFALLANKTFYAYFTLFSKINELVLHGPNLIMSDFERATLNAAIEVFPSVEQSE